MDIVFLLVPLSVVLVFLIVLLFWWSVHSGQFEDLDAQAERILDEPHDAAASGPHTASDNC